MSLKFDNPEARLAHDFPLDMQQEEVKEMLQGHREHRASLSRSARNKMQYAERRSHAEHFWKARRLLARQALLMMAQADSIGADSQAAARQDRAAGLGASAWAAFTSARRRTRTKPSRSSTTAIDAGINFFDNAWEYHEGKSEEWLGAALKGKRDKRRADDQGLHARPRQERRHAACSRNRCAGCRPIISMSGRSTK